MFLFVVFQSISWFKLFVANFTSMVWGTLALVLRILKHCHLAHATLHSYFFMSSDMSIISCQAEEKLLAKRAISLNFVLFFVIGVGVFFVIPKLWISGEGFRAFVAEVALDCSMFLHMNPNIAKISKLLSTQIASITAVFRVNLRVFVQQRFKREFSRTLSALKLLFNMATSDMAPQIVPVFGCIRAN